jgi:protein phosphatase
VGETTGIRAAPPRGEAAAPARRTRVPVLEIAVRCDIGRVRRTNQDTYRVDADHGVVVVADGMGGHRAGEVASRIAADTVLERMICLEGPAELDPSSALGHLGRSVEEANAALFRAIADNSDLQGMGTTLVAVVFCNGHVYHAHVGDSRLYRWRAGTLESLTRDHSLVQSLLDRGVFGSREQARAAGVGTHILTRGLGVEQNLDVELGSHPVEHGDVYLLCTDGLTNMIDDPGLAELFSEHGYDVHLVADRMLEMALAEGGVDNVTLVLVRPVG